MQFVSVAVKPMIAWLSRGLTVLNWPNGTDGTYGTNWTNGDIPAGRSFDKSHSSHKSHWAHRPAAFDPRQCFPYNFSFSATGRNHRLEAGDSRNELRNY